MLNRESLLQAINEDIPKGVDWKAGAEKYVAAFVEKLGREGIEEFAMNKPFSSVGASDPGPAITESVHYINNFANALQFLKPPLGSRILDVACGGGWVSHLLSKMGYWTYGIDISEDFVNLAARRLSRDASLSVSETEAASRFSVHDIETSPLPSHLVGTFDYIWLESCLHHFVDPITALEHLSAALKPDGVIVLIEFENRRGEIKPEYMEVMREFDTLERPYPRDHLVNALHIAGLTQVEFIGTVNGWFSPSDPMAPIMGDLLLDSAEQMNLAICAKKQGRLDEIFPHRAKDASIRFGRGAYENANGYRWCAPAAELVVEKSICNMTLECFSTLFESEGCSTQEIVAYGKNGELDRISLSAESKHGELKLGNLERGDKVSIYSNQAFSPAWSGSDDARLLSFYIKTSD
ncbi:class I SAM-dependent methyltransferase [Pseudomonas sp. OV226]|uniref:class I SAM-dependent methyltransferase n=1 Tax=Pseudomonas sp. OV226 TaxID=2135588 RepID=UPI000D6D66A4|nr:class I SAM-dependent methyltransferase [Pseudomonas sp. OV226]PWK30844.1 methyltransferase family protein [Pseudomonas sp. OV226]